MKDKVVSVFGNPIEESDSLAVRLIPKLQMRFPELDFRVIDPTEILEAPSNPWIILDVGMGIKKVVVIESLDQLEHVGGQSVHDFDVYMELRLQKKLGKLPKIKIIIMPMQMTEEIAINNVEKHLIKILS